MTFFLNKDLRSLKGGDTSYLNVPGFLRVASLQLWSGVLKPVSLNIGLMQNSKEIFGKIDHLHLWLL